VLTGGFFESRKAGPADKQPFAFAMGNREIMTMAGLWEPCQAKGAGQSHIETMPRQATTSRLARKAKTSSPITDKIAGEAIFGCCQLIR